MGIGEWGNYGEIGGIREIGDRVKVWAATGDVFKIEVS
jgi:hypothetical protein